MKRGFTYKSLISYRILSRRLAEEKETASLEGWPFLSWKEFRGSSAAAGPAQGNNLQFDLGQARLGHGELLGCGIGKVDDAAFIHQVASIVDLDDDRVLVCQVDNADKRTEGEGGVAGCVGKLIEPLAAGCLASLKDPAVPGCNAVEFVASFDGGLLRHQGVPDQGIRCWCCDWRCGRQGCSDGSGKPRIRVHCANGERDHHSDQCNR